MGLLDKIKDLFMEEDFDEDEIEIEEEETVNTKKNVLPTVMRENIKTEEKKNDDFLKKTNTSLVKDNNSENGIERSQTKKFNLNDFENEFSRVELHASNKAVDNKNNLVDKTVNNDFDKRENSRLNIGSKTTLNVTPSRSSGLTNSQINLEKDNSRRNVELYPKKSEEKNLKPKFKASPVISPVYGVLDKNYTKEQVKEKTEDNTTMKRPSKKVDFETVRKKAFGNLVDEIKDNMLCENCELYKEVKKITSLKEDDLLYDMTVDDEEDKPLTIEKAYDNYEEFGIAYEPEKKKVENNLVNEDNFDLSDNQVVNSEVDTVLEETNKESNISFSDVLDNNEISLRQEDNKFDERVNVSNKEDDDKLDVIDFPSREEKKKDAKVDADFFELIDSMYKERVDE